MIIFTVLSLHFGVQCSLIVGLVFSIAYMQQTTLMCIKSNLGTMNRPENDQWSGNVTGLTAVNNGTVPVR